MLPHFFQAAFAISLIFVQLWLSFDGGRKLLLERCRKWWWICSSDRPWLSIKPRSAFPARLSVLTRFEIIQLMSRKCGPPERNPRDCILFVRVSKKKSNYSWPGPGKVNLQERNPRDSRNIINCSSYYPKKRQHFSMIKSRNHSPVETPKNISSLQLFALKGTPDTTDSPKLPESPDSGD